MNGLQRGAEAARRQPRRPEQDQRPDRHRARRLHQRRRHAADGREDRSEDARGAVAGGAQGLRPRRRGAARRVDAAARGVRRLPARRRLRDPPRDRFPEHGLRARAVPGRSQGRDVRLDSRERDSRSGSRRTPRSSSSTRRARRRSARSSSGCGASATSARRAIGQSLEERFSFLMKQLKINDTAERGVAVRARCRRFRSTARRRSSPPAGRSPPPRKRPKGSRTDDVADRTRSSRLRDGFFVSSWLRGGSRCRPPRAHRITPATVSCCASTGPAPPSRSRTTPSPGSWTRWRCRST